MFLKTLQKSLKIKSLIKFLTNFCLYIHLKDYFMNNSAFIDFNLIKIYSFPDSLNSILGQLFVMFSFCKRKYHILYFLDKKDVLIFIFISTFHMVKKKKTSK